MQSSQIVPFVCVAHATPMCAKSNNIEHVIPAIAVMLHHKLNCANSDKGGPFKDMEL